MTVFVDDMRARYGRMVMCHMIADSVDELHAMADTIGVARRWYQGDHYDVCQAKRSAAIYAGAVVVTRRQASAMVARRRETGMLGSPADAESWFKAFIRERG